MLRFAVAQFTIEVFGVWVGYLEIKKGRYPSDLIRMSSLIETGVFRAVWGVRQQIADPQRPISDH